MRNALYYGDNLPIMREHIPDESVDLVYLDPPFNSARDYNVLFKQAKKDEKDFGLKRGVDYDVIGDPKDAYSAHKLFEESPKQFEIWAVGLVAGVPQPEKSGDKGVDGKVYFMDLEGKLQCAVCQVKGGHLKIDDIHAFAHVIEVQKAAMGFFICLDTPTKGMYDRADELGFFDSPSGRKIPKLQIRTIKELLEGKEFDFPKGYSLKSGGGKRLVRHGEQGELGL